jgi:uncharacterized protein YfaS (alpha-2-macroglobulin family)
MLAFQADPPVSVDRVAASYSHGTLYVSISSQGLHAGEGQLVVEVLNPEDKVLGRSERLASVGALKSEVRLEKPLALDDLVWQRIRYRFAYRGQTGVALQGIESISNVLRRPVLHILGQQTYLAGGPAAVRIVVTDSKNQAIAGPGSIKIGLLTQDQKSQLLFTGQTNERGTTAAQFRFPARLSGSYSLRYMVDTPIGSTEFTQPVRIEDKASILLTTEKPLYQPGQTIHVRALALDRSNHEASASRKLTFELEDSRGNKVFKKATQTDRFGVASAEFALADEVNLGTYHLRAVMDDNTAESALSVERYVLPKFKVSFEFGGTDRAKRGYRPGDHVTGTVRANYFFGKAVNNAEITVKATGLDVAQFEAGSLQGKTDADGGYRFDLHLPSYFAGRPLSQGAARVLVEATVKDSAGHSETRGEPITVSQTPLIITAVPEGGTLVPNLETQVFILTSYPGGLPATAHIKVHATGNPDLAATTDEGGVAVIRIKAGAGAEKLEIVATDKEGNRASTSANLDARSGEDQILLRTERALYSAGDRIQLKLFSTKNSGAAYVDVVKDGQTVLTRDLDIVNGQAELAVPATPDLAGALDISAYLFGRDARPVSDHRLVFVQPAGELKIEATADAPVHRPGEEARVQFHVTNSHGEGVEAALGLQVVDEAVFALAEKQPGFAKVFFYLEQEVMKPRYEIHSIGLPDIVEPVETSKAGQRDRAAQALFSATEIVRSNHFETESGRDVPQTKYVEYWQRYQTSFVAQARRVVEANKDVADAWGTNLRIEHLAWGPNAQYLVRSAGPDRKFNTPDDHVAYLEVRTSTRPGAIDVSIEHDRGPFNGRAEIVGTAQGAMVSVREVSTGKERAAMADTSGRFDLAGLEPGTYEVRVSIGSEAISRKLTLNARDRAVVSVMRTVAVIEVPQRFRFGGNVAHLGFARGAPVGVIGGIAGGAPAMQFDAGRLMAPAPPPPAKAAMVPSAPRVRSYFPEALYINPEIITDQHGFASITIPLADSITTWRMAMAASTVRGALGSGTASLKVFQDFFADIDLPVTLTQGDRVSIPVAIYNYSGSRGDVRLHLQPDDWYSLVEDSPEKTLAVESGRVGGSQFTLEAKRIGKFKLTLSANMLGEADRADIIVREIEVIPNGREQNVVFNGRLEAAVHNEVDFPAVSIPDASKIFVRLYPGPLSQVIEGMDSILRMPGGCFEQTSSSTYPNVLALDYMKRAKKLTPEVHAKAEGYIANGYQRLLTFEVPGGGFSWFGNAPANKILTAYGLMEFYDMSKVHDVDLRVISRTQQWLAGQQQPDGSWKPDTSFINEGATNRYNSDVLRITAYIAWALGNTGYQGPAVEKAKQFVESHMSAKLDNYTLAVLANFAADYRKDRNFTRQAMELLLGARTQRDDQAWWTAEETSVYATGSSASVETTGLAVQALLKWGGDSVTAGKALRYIAGKKDASGAWGTTQATIMALRAVLLSTEKGASDVRGAVEITLNGKPVQKLILTVDNNDLLHQFVLPGVRGQGANAVSVRFEGKGGLAYQVVGRYFVPWDEKPAGESLSIAVAYDRTSLAQNDIAAATATIRNNLSKTANMVMVDLGIPPGFDLLSEDLQDYQQKTTGRKSGALEKFSQTATQAILYFNSLAPGETVTLHFRLRAKYPIRARTFLSRVYEYYDPEVSSIARPVQLEVRSR